MRRVSIWLYGNNVLYACWYLYLPKNLSEKWHMKIYARELLWVESYSKAYFDVWLSSHPSKMPSQSKPTSYFTSNDMHFATRIYLPRLNLCSTCIFNIMRFAVEFCVCYAINSHLAFCRWKLACNHNNNQTNKMWKCLYITLAKHPI